jgi:hypothetical protein
VTQNDRLDGGNGVRARRWLVGAATLALVAALGACSGDDGNGDGDGDGRGQGAVELPTGADDVVLRLGDGPMPTLLIAGDGAVYEPAAESSSAEGWSAEGWSAEGWSAVPLVVGRPAIAPAPTGPAPMTVLRLTQEGLQRVFQRADELAMLDTPPEYADVSVTDSSSTYLELRDADGTYEHVAYALGYDDEEIDDERQAFADLLDDLDDLERLAGRGNLSDPEPYAPDTYVVTVDSLVAAGGRDWPADVPLEEGCVELLLERFPGPVAGTYRYDADDTDRAMQRVWVVPYLPGDDC